MSGSGASTVVLQDSHAGRLQKKAQGEKRSEHFVLFVAKCRAFADSRCALHSRLREIFQLGIRLASKVGEASE